MLTRKSMEGFRLLFGNELPPWRMLRNSGLNLVDRVPLLKNRLARQAMGMDA
ncbi:MAG: hypothetical protein R3E95_10060 [Thiolinea sp.]